MLSFNFISGSLNGLTGQLLQHSSMFMRFLSNCDILLYKIVKNKFFPLRADTNIEMRSRIENGRKSTLIDQRIKLFESE